MYNNLYYSLISTPIPHFGCKSIKKSSKIIIILHSSFFILHFFISLQTETKIRKSINK